MIIVSKWQLFLSYGLHVNQNKKMQKCIVSEFGYLLLPHNPSVWFIEDQQWCI